MKIKFNAIVKITLILLLVFSWVSITYFQVDKGSETTSFSYNKTSSLINLLEKTSNLDGGFREILPQDQKVDLYSTYYSLQIIKDLDIKFKMKQELPFELNKLLLKDNSYDTLTNIYYYVSIYGDMLNRNQRAEIVEYLNSLEKEDGTFAYSPYEKRQKKIYDTKEVIFPTYQAIKIYKILNYERDYKKIEKLIVTFLNDSENYNTDNLLNSGYILNIIQMSQLINFDIQEKSERLKVYSKKVNYILNTSLKQKDFNIFILNNIVLLNEVIGNNIEKSDLDRIGILNYINKLKVSNGGFGISPGAEVNILPTSIAVEIAKKLNSEIYDKKAIYDFIKLYQLENNGFTQIIYLDSNIYSSILAENMILTLNLNSKFKKNKYLNKVSYMKAISYDPKNLDMFHTYIYLSTHPTEECIGCGLPLYNKIYKDILSTKEFSSPSITLSVYYGLLILEQFKPDLFIDLKPHIEFLISKSNTGYSTLDTTIINLITKKYNLTQVLTINDFKNMKINNILELYFVLENFQKYNNNIEKDYWKKQIYSFQNKDGTFRMEKKKDATATFFSTFYGINCLEILEKN